MTVIGQGSLVLGSLSPWTYPTTNQGSEKLWLRKAEVARVIAAVKPKIGPHSKPEGKAKARQAADELRFILYCGFHAGLRRREISMGDLAALSRISSGEPEQGGQLLDAKFLLVADFGIVEPISGYGGAKRSLARRSKSPFSVTELPLFEAPGLGLPVTKFRPRQ